MLKKRCCVRIFAMKNWLKVTTVLCTFGFFREFRPSEPFVTQYLSGEWRNISSVELNREVYPIGTYSNLVLLVLVFLVTDVLRYKPIIISSACSGIVIWSMLLWTKSLVALQLVQVCYGFYMASEVAYYTYMYAKVDKSLYQKVTSYARTSTLSGRFLASIIAQILVSFDLMDLRELNFLTFGAQTISLIVAVILPSVGISLYFFAVRTNSQENSESSDNSIGRTSDFPSSMMSKEDYEVSVSEPPHFSYNRAWNLLWQHFLQSYSNPTVLLWSFYWSLAMGGFLQVQIYVQLLWQQIDVGKENFFNGAVEAAVTFFGALSAFGAGFVASEIFQKFDNWILIVCSLLEGVLIIISSITSSVWIAYLMYVLFGVIYMFMITMANATVATHLADDSFALIFGINTFVALLFQSILTIVVISVLELDPRGQFLAYGIYFVSLAIILIVFTLIRNCRRRNIVMLLG